MNKVLIVGNLVRDPQITLTTSNIKYARMTIAVNRPFAKDKADFVPVVAWRQSADFVEKYLKKGISVWIEGRFTSSSYQNQEGKTIYSQEVTIENIGFGGRKDSQQDLNQSIVNPTNPGADIKFEEESKKETKIDDVPWELEL